MQSYTGTFAAILAITACGGEEANGTKGGAGAGGSATGGAVTGSAGLSSPGGAVTGGTSTTGGTTGGREVPSCNDCAPCGGDVVGTWSVVSSCLDVSGEVDLSSFGLTTCTTPVTGTLQVSGALTLYEDGTLEDHTTTTGASEFLVSLAVDCVGISERPADAMCASLGSSLHFLGFASVVCVHDEAADGCACAATVEQTGRPGFVSPQASPNGTYKTANTVLTVSYATDVEYDYCVPENYMTLAPRTVSVTGTVTGNVVLQLQ